MVETTDSSTTMDGCSSITEKSSPSAQEVNALANALEWKRKFEILQVKMSKRSSKRQKRLEKKTAQVKMQDIEVKNHLPSDKQYLVRTHVRKTIWRNLKYWNDKFEKRAVRKALKVADIQDPHDKKKYCDFTGAYVTQLLIVKRNNSVAALKKTVMNEIESKCRETFSYISRLHDRLLTNAFIVKEFSLTDKFDNWGVAVKAVMDARSANISPYNVDRDIWRIFEIMAFELVPRING